MALRPELIYPKEKPLFVIGLIFSSLVWLALAITIVGIFYGLAIFAFILIAHALFLAYVRGNGVRVSEEQFPEIHTRAAAAAQKLGLPRTPEIYILQHGGFLNAFATKLLSRHYVILLSDLVDGCHDPRQLDFIVGHEMTHLAAGHLTWNTVLAPFRILPWVGPAYARACEYTCDRGGHYIAGDLEQSKRALVVLAAGGKLAQKANLDAFMRQGEEAGRFWMAIHELVSSHPFLSKRVRALQELAHPGTAPAQGRNFFAWLLAPMLGAGVGGGASAVIAMMVLWVGVGAAVAVPAFLKYQSSQKSAFAQLQDKDPWNSKADAFAGELGADPYADDLGAFEEDDAAAEAELERIRAEFEAMDRKAAERERRVEKQRSRPVQKKVAQKTQPRSKTVKASATEPAKKPTRKNTRPSSGGFGVE